MQKINSANLDAPMRASPKGIYGGSVKELSVALGRDANSTDRLKQHPFDVAIATIPSGKALCPLHMHDAQWEFYHVISGRGVVREIDTETQVGPGDAFLFKPGEAHQLRNDEEEDFVLYIIASNPDSDHCYYPDSKKWKVSVPEQQLVRSEALDYFDGEE